MFRKPMRLEKWVAFDGALGSDAVDSLAAAGQHESLEAPPDSRHADGVANAEPQADADGAAPFIATFAVPGDESNSIQIDLNAGRPGNEVEFTLPVGFQIDGSTDAFCLFGMRISPSEWLPDMTCGNFS